MKTKKNKKKIVVFFVPVIFIILMIILLSKNNINAQNVGVSDVSFTPQGMLHIYKSTAGPSSLFQVSNVTSGSAATDGLTFDFDASFNSTFNNRENTYLQFNTNATQRMRILSTGQIGINKTPGTTFYLDVTSASTTADDGAIFGSVTGNAKTYGILGTTTSTTLNGSGIRGYASGATGATNGLWGEAASSTGAGVYGLATHANGDGIYALNSAVAGAGFGSGIYGESSQSGGAGVWGDGNTNSAGVFGTSAKSHVWNSAVYGENANSTSGTSWSYDQVTCGVSGRATGTAIYATGVYGYNSNSAVNDNAAVFAQDGQGYISGLTFTFTPGATQRTLGVYGRGTGGADDRAIQGEWSTAAGDPWGFIGAFDRGVYGDAGTVAAGIGVAGFSAGSTGYGIYGENTAAAVGAVGTFGYASSTTAGTGFLISTCRKSVFGKADVTGSYRFGVYGNGGNSTRSGGVIGHDNGAAFYAAGALGYYSSTSVDIAVYGFGAAYTTGGSGGKLINPGINSRADEIKYNTWSVQKPNNMIGLGIYGGVMGGWIKGLVYGTNLSGVRYGAYVHGKTITNNFIATLNDINGSEERVPTFNSSAMKIEITEKGRGNLINGKAVISFSKNFSGLISIEEPVIIIVTPLGKCKGLYIEKSSLKEFSVGENDEGNSSIEFNWIAIAVKKGFEKPFISPEILSNDFEEIMNGNSGVMYNDSNPADPLYSIWWDGNQVRFDRPHAFKTETKEESTKIKLLK